MNLPQGAHVAVVDGSQFHLFTNDGTATDPRLKKVDTKDIDTSNKSAGIRDHDAADRQDGGRTMEELGHAAGVTDRLNHAVLTHKIDRLFVIADPQTLGEMRRHYHKELSGALIGELDKTLTNSGTDDILRAIDAA